MVGVLAMVTVPVIWGYIDGVVTSGAVPGPAELLILSLLVGLNVFVAWACRNAWRGKGRWFGPAIGAACCFAVLVGLVVSTLLTVDARYHPLPPAASVAIGAVGGLLPVLAVLLVRHRKRRLAGKRIWPAALAGGGVGAICLLAFMITAAVSVVSARTMVADYGLEAHLSGVARNVMLESLGHDGQGPESLLVARLSDAAGSEPGAAANVDSPPVAEQHRDDPRYPEVVTALEYLCSQAVPNYDQLPAAERRRRITSRWSEDDIIDWQGLLVWYAEPVLPDGQRMLVTGDMKVLRVDEATFQQMIRDIEKAHGSP
jgi:hypothetical protein